MPALARMLRCEQNAIIPSVMESSPQLPKSGESGKKCRVVFRWTESNDIDSAALAGTFTDWQPLPLKPGRSSAFERIVYLPPGRHEYRFIVDGEWREDPLGREFSPNPFGGRNAVLHLP